MRFGLHGDCDVNASELLAECEQSVGKLLQGVRDSAYVLRATSANRAMARGRGSRGLGVMVVSKPFQPGANRVSRDRRISDERIAATLSTCVTKTAAGSAGNRRALFSFLQPLRTSRTLREARIGESEVRGIANKFAPTVRRQLAFLCSGTHCVSSSRPFAVKTRLEL